MSYFLYLKMRLLLFILFSIPLVLNAQVPEWNQFRGPDKTGSVQYRVPATLKLFQQVWEYQPERGTATSALVYKNTLIFGQGTSYYCLDRMTGKEIWKTKVQELNKWGAQTSQPSVGDGRLYFGTREGFMFCLDAANGSVLWKSANHRIVTSSPAIANGMVYYSGFDTLFHAVDAKTGKEIWNYPTMGGDASPVVRDNTVFVGSDKGWVYALNATDGKLIWKFKTGDRNYSGPVYNNGMVFFPSDDGRMYAFNALTGENTWVYQVKSYLFDFPVAFKNMIIVSSYSGALIAIDAVTGTMVWTKQFNIISDPIVVNDVLLIDTYSSSSPSFARNMVIALDPETGKELWQFNHSIGISGEPVVSDKMVYMSCGYVYGYQSYFGSLLNSVPFACPVIDNQN